MAFRAKVSSCVAAAIFAFAAPAMADGAARKIGVEALSIQDGELAGPGGERLKSRFASSQFILLGEDHGFADSPELALAIARATKPYGFDYHVVEVGPLSEEWASAIVKNQGVEGLAVALEGRPLALPFLMMREDAELAEYFLNNASRRQDALWGVDQEFIGSPLIHLEKLNELARTSAAKELAGSLLAAERAAFAEGRQNDVFMFSASADTFADLREAFADTPEAASIVAALEESAAIYGLYAQGKNYASNARRVALLRRQFLSQYREARGRAPRVLLKMGANHLSLGTTFLNTVDLGSLLEGMAAENRLGAARILFIPLEGKVTQIRPSADGAFATVDYRSEEIASLLKTLEISEDAIADEGWSLIPLEPVRQKLGQEGLNALSGEMRSFVLGFDYLVTTRGARAATPLAN